MKTLKCLHRLDLVFALALLLKLFSAGFSYFCVLDDYVQYGSYPMFDLSYVYFHIGTLSARPLASLLDPALWGAFFPHMAFALLLIGILYFLSAVWLDRSLAACGIKITPVLYTVYLLLPLTFEGTYWISASSRIVVGLFFAALSARLLIKYLTTGKKAFVPLYTLSCLASFGFYESVLIFSGLLQLFVLGTFACKRKKFKKLWLLMVPAVCAILMLIYYKLAANIGTLGSRASGFSLENMGDRVTELFSQFFYIFTAGLFRTTIAGFVDGLRVMANASSTGWILGILVLAVSLLCAWFSKKHKLCAKAKCCVPLGLALTLLPLLPNLLVPDVWLTYRSIVVCLPGLCVLFAPLAASLFKNRHVRMSAVFVMVFIFSVGCINEVHTYKTVNELDNALIAEVVEALDEDVLAGGKNTILVLPCEIAVPQTSYYKDHVKSVFYADWALTGAVRAATRNNNIKQITPVLSLDGIDTAGKLILYMDTSYHVTEVQND